MDHNIRRENVSPQTSQREGDSPTKAEAEANSQRLHFILERLTNAWEEWAALEDKLNSAAKPTPKRTAKPEAKSFPTGKPEPEPTPEPKPQARGLKAAVRVGRGQVDTTAGIRDRLKK